MFQQAILDSADFTIITTDVNGTILCINAGAERMLGYGADEMVGRLTPIVIHDPEEVKQRARLLSAELGLAIEPGFEVFVTKARMGMPNEYEWTYIRKDGSRFPVLLSVTAVRNSSGELLGFLGIGRDITERRQAEIGRREAEDQLRSAREMLQLVINTIPLFVFWKDREGRFLGCNERFAIAGGLGSAEDIVGKTDYDLSWREQADLYRGDDFEVMASELAKYSYAEPQSTLDGSKIWLETSKVPLRNAQSQVVGVLGVYQDVTERRQAREKERQAAKVFESTQEGIMITDLNGKILTVNPAFTEITGYAEADVVGKSPRILKSGRHEPAFYAAMWTSLESTGCWQGEVWNRRKSGDIYPEWLTVSSVTDDSGTVVNYVAVFSDISLLKVSQEQLERLAHHDPLTGLPNRLMFRDRLEHAMQRADRARTQLALLFLDLDRFKRVNDSLGHTVGDDLLRSVAERLSKVLRRDDTLARLGGDEFTVLIEGLSEGDHAAHIAEKLVDALIEPFLVQGHELVVGASIGISIYPRDARSTETLLRNADAAMYRAKDAGRNTFCFYSEEMTTTALERVLLEGQLRRAIEQGELLLHYQPQVDLSSGQVIGVEALVRWRHPEHGVLSPDRFIPIAEDSGLIVPLGDWVLRSACAQGKAWLDSGIDFGRVCVNIAGLQLRRGRLRDSVQRILAETGLPPERLELEITESFIMGQPKQNVDLLISLRKFGVALAIDDFGTGYSSLAHLKQIPIDKLKIDQSFIRDLPDDDNDSAIARAVIALGHSLQFKVIAEGVENTAQQEFLQSAGCDQAQGFLYRRPVPAEALLLNPMDLNAKAFSFLTN